MSLRQVLLRIILVALAIAAFAGVVGVIVAVGDTLWRIVGTGVATAVAVAILIPFSVFIDKQVHRNTGIAGFCWTVVTYLLVLALIWAGPLFHFSNEEHLALTLLFWIVCGVPSLIFLHTAAVPWGRFAGSTGVGVGACVFLLLLIGSWGEEYSFSNNCMGSGATLAVAGLTAAGCLINAGRKDRRHWRWIGVVAAGIGLLLATYGIWGSTHSDVGRQFIGVCFSVAAWIALANISLQATLIGAQAMARWGTLAAAVICAMAMNGLIPDGLRPMEDLFQRIAAGSAIVTGCGCLALVVFSRLNRKAEFRPEEGSKTMIEMHVACPRCSKKQELAIGESACSGCGLRITIKIEEPRCAQCGYLLYLLTSPRCPECGFAIGGVVPVVAAP